MSTLDKTADLLGSEASMLLEHICQQVPGELLTKPGPDYLDKVFINSNRNPQVLRSLNQLFGHGNLANTGYLSILPVDQGIFV